MSGTRQVKQRWTGGVVECGTGEEEEREQGVKTLGGDGNKDRRMLTQNTDLKLSLRGSVG